jgi:hypothetical protein
MESVVLHKLATKNTQEHGLQEKNGMLIDDGCALFGQILFAGIFS